MSEENKKAVQIFEEVISLNESETTTLKALHEIALIRIGERDIYQAYYTLDRLETIPSNVPYLQLAKKFLEGAISMVKKKYREGLEHLEGLSSAEDLTPQLKPLVLSYRAFGHFCEGSIEQALQDYEALQKRGELSEGDEYNKQLCQGVLRAEEQRFDESLSFFTRAQRMSPGKIEPKFYLAVLPSKAAAKHHPVPQEERGGFQGLPARF